MKRLVVGIVAAAVLASMARTAAAQSKTVTSEMKVQAGTVEAIDPERARRLEKDLGRRPLSILLGTAFPPLTPQAAWQVDDLPGMRHGLSPKRCAQTVDHRRQRRPGSDRFSVQYQH